MVHRFSCRFRSAFTVLLLAILGLTLSGCYTTSKYPIAVDEQPQSDPRLWGLWYGSLEEDGDEPFYLHFLPENLDDDEATNGETPKTSDEAMTALIVFHGAAEDPSESGWGNLRAVSAQTDELSFISFKFIFMTDSDLDEDEGYHLYVYRIGQAEDGQAEFQLQRLSDDYLEAQIESGALSGEISRGQYTTSALVTASSSELAANLQGKTVEDIAEPEIGRFVRITAP